VRAEQIRQPHLRLPRHEILECLNQLPGIHTQPCIQADYASRFTQYVYYTTNSLHQM
jgi:hypothetical protein